MSLYLGLAIISSPSKDFPYYVAIGASVLGCNLPQNSFLLSQELMCFSSHLHKPGYYSNELGVSINTVLIIEQCRYTISDQMQEVLRKN